MTSKIRVPYLDRVIVTNMRIPLVIFMCGVIGIQVTLTEKRHFAYQRPRLRHRPIPILRQPATDQVLGPIQFHGSTGKLPSKYTPLSKADEYAAFKIMSNVPELTRYIPQTASVKHIGPINIELPEYWLRGKLLLNDFIVRGLNQVTLQNIEVRLKNDRADFNILAPHISADVNFEFDGNVGIIPFSISGTVSFGVQDLNPSGAVGIKKTTTPSNGEVYQIESGEVDMELQSLAVSINDNSDSDADIGALETQVLEGAKDQIADILLVALIKEINKELAKVPASKIHSLISKAY